MEIKKMPKNAEIFICKKCDFKCSKKSNYEKHLATAKHLRKQNGNNMEMIVHEKYTNEFKCLLCNKIYNTNSGLWKHSKKCKVVEEINKSENEVKLLTNLVMEIVKSNQQLQEQMLEVCQKIQPINNNSHNNY